MRFPMFYLMNIFQSKVYEVVTQIPKGQTLTYKEVAAKVGSPGAYRAVGSVLKKNYNPSIPCHRVVKSNGQPGEYNRGISNKIALLLAEGAISQ